VLRQRIFEIPGVVSIGVRESANRVKVGIESPDVESDVRKLMSELGISNASVMFVLEGPGQDLRHARRYSGAALALTLQNKQPNGVLQGGWEIRSATGNVCTLGFTALRASDLLPVFVTNSHCTAQRTHDDGTTFTQPTGLPLVGQEIKDPPAYTCGYPLFEDDCRNSDSAMMRADVNIDLGRIARTTQASSVGCEHCVMSLDINLSQPTFKISSRNDNVFQNETLNKVGRTSGWTRGNVEDTCDDFKSGIPGADDPWVKQCSDRVDFAMDPGDSGSPVFSVLSNGTVQLRGIAFAEQTCCVGYYDAWMTDLNQIQKDLGQLIVHDPGPPVVDIFGPTEVAPGQYCSWTAQVVNGVPPFSYQWSGIFTGSGSSVAGFAGSGGNLNVQVTDRFGRVTADAIVVVVAGTGPPICE
jgi:hypothetical protein